jgi:DNA-binding transcriptional regulator YhcF (GntR family)
MEINQENSKPVFEQIYDQFHTLIEKGVYRKGEKLPTIREEALELAVNPGTVLKAYRLLAAEGYVSMGPKVGIIVIYTPVRYKDLADVPDFYTDINSALAEPQDILPSGVPDIRPPDTQKVKEDYPK